MTERKRAVHFALMDTAFAADRKFVRLAHKAPNPADYAAAVGVFWLILADCRRSKSPEIAWTEYEEYGPQLGLLKEVGLLNGTGFPSGPFDKWAPVYKSPWDANRGTKGDGQVRAGTQRDDASIQLDSPHLPSTGEVGGVGEGEGSDSGAPLVRKIPLPAPVFLGFPPKKPKKLTAEEIASYRRYALTSSDPLVASNAREMLEKLGIPVEESA